MKILITGITGLIGQSLAHQLSQKGFILSGLTRNAKKAQKNISFPCSLYEWKDIHTPPPESAFKDISAIIHLAGEAVINKRWSPGQKEILTQSRVQYLHQLILMAKKYPHIHTLISAGAIGYYGHRENEWLTENSPQGRGFIPHLCVNWEKTAKTFEDHTKRAVIFRIGHVLSPNGGIIQKTAPLFRLGLGCIFSDGKQWVSWIHINDLIDLFTQALENKHWSGVFNAVSPHPVTHEQWSKKLARACHRPLFLRIPKFALKWGLGEISQLILSSQRALPEQAQKKGFIFNFPHLEPALKNILS